MRKTNGFTLVELLVVIAVIGGLLGLLLPAVLGARESARRARCADNLREIGTALHGFQLSRGAFPPGNYAKTAGVCPGRRRPGVDSPSEDGANWMILILPHLGLESLYRAYDQSTYNEAPENRDVRETSIGVYICPSDTATDELTIPAFGPASQYGLGVPYMPGSYRGVSGRSDGRVFLDWAQDVDYPRRWRGPLHTVGVLGLSAESTEDITDGLANTLMVGESTTETGREYRTLWAYSYAFYSLSSTTAQARTLYGDYQRCRSEEGPGYSLPCRRGWGSPHGGGLNFLLCDGTVRFIDEAIDMDLFADLGTIAGGEPGHVPP